MATKNERRGLLSEMSIEELQDWLEEALADEDEGVAAILEREIAGREKAAETGKKALKDKKEKLWGRDDTDTDEDEEIENPTADNAYVFSLSMGGTPSGTPNAGRVSLAAAALSRSIPGRRAAEKAQHQAVGARAIDRLAAALSISSSSKKKPSKLQEAIKALTRNISA